MLRLDPDFGSLKIFTFGEDTSENIQHQAFDYSSYAEKDHLAKVYQQIELQGFSTANGYAQDETIKHCAICKCMHHTGMGMSTNQRGQNGLHS